MKIDNTMFGMYYKCGLLYYERYEAPNDDVQRLQNGSGLVQIAGAEVGGGGSKSESQSLDLGLASGDPHHDNRFADRGIELDKPSEGRDFGTRMHQLLHERRLAGLGLRPAGHALAEGERCPEGQFQPAPEWPDESIESECQATLAAYEAHYIRDYVYLESERTHVLQLPAICGQCGGIGEPIGENRYRCKACQREFTRHELVVKLDAVVRHLDGTIGPFDTKTEARQGYNAREDWAGRTQAKIYLYALGALYPTERVSRLVVDVVGRGSPKARRGPLFYRHDDISSSPEAISEAIRNVVCVADDIERSRLVGWWRSNMNVCKKGWEVCDYYPLHIIGRTEANLRKYRPAEAYLDL